MAGSRIELLAACATDLLPLGSVARDSANAGAVSKQQRETLQALKELRAFVEHQVQEEQRARQSALLALQNEMQDRFGSGLGAQQQTLEDLHAAVEVKLDAEERAHAEVRACADAVAPACVPRGRRG